MKNLILKHLWIPNFIDSSLLFVGALDQLAIIGFMLVFSIGVKGYESVFLSDSMI